MKQELILYPVFAMVLQTVVVALTMLKQRFQAVRQDGLNPAYFQLNRGAKLPDYLAKTSNHYANLFELPVLFYVVCLILLLTQRVDVIYLSAAWVFVALRVVHAYVHITYNNLKHRRNVFLAGALVITLIWVRLSIHVLTA
jgi:hypothetical protein